MLVVVIKGLIIIVNFWKIRVGENIGQNAQLAALTGHKFAFAIANPATFPLVLILPFLRKTDSGLGLHIVEPGVFHTVATGPHVFTGDGTSVTTDAFVEIQNHANLCANFHYFTPSTAVLLSSSSQSTSLILRTMTNSSRLHPTVP